MKTSPIRQSPEPLMVNRLRSASRQIFLLSLGASQLAYAQTMPGQALLNYVTPIILFLTIGAILIALGAALVAPQFAKAALYTALIGVIIFFVMKTAPALAVAVQN